MLFCWLQVLPDCKYITAVIPGSVMVCITSSFVSPRPSMMPLLVLIPTLFQYAYHFHAAPVFSLNAYSIYVSLSMVSMLWSYRSGAASNHRWMFSFYPLWNRNQCFNVCISSAPSLLLYSDADNGTPVFNFIPCRLEIDDSMFYFSSNGWLATRCGSSQSTGSGLPVATAQKPQAPGAGTQLS